MSKPVHPLLKRLLRQSYAKGLSNLALIEKDGIPRVRQKDCVTSDVVGCQRYMLGDGLNAHVYTPKENTTDLPVLIYFPASGYIFDRHVDSAAFCRHLSHTLQFAVIYPELPLAPKRQFLGLMTDVRRLVEWIASAPKGTAFNREAVTCWGESSGAHLAACFNHQHCKDRILPIQHQVLIYPTLDLFNSYPSKEAYQKGYLIDSVLIEHLFEQLVDSCLQADSPILSPVLSEDFSDLPPTTLVTAEYDPFRDEANLYAKRLQEAGIPVRHQQYNGMIHGFLRFTHKIKEANEALSFALAGLQHLS